METAWPSPTSLVTFALVLPLLGLALARLVRLTRALLPATTCPRVVHNVLYPYGVCDTIGRRDYMEDRHVVAGELRGDARMSLYAVFDGHAGHAAADYCVQRMVPLLVADETLLSSPAEAISNAFSRTDSEFLQRARQSRPPLDDGTTAIAALVVGDTVIVANAGDSRAILVHRDGNVRALSDDHKPNRPDEVLRIKQAGGTVYFHGVWRVSGILAVSRAIGDRLFKPFVTATPEIQRVALSSEDSFLILASDGIWDVISSEEAGRVVVSVPPIVGSRASSINDRKGERGAYAQSAAARLVRLALDRGSMDNVTALVIDVREPRERLNELRAMTAHTDGATGATAIAGTAAARAVAADAFDAAQASDIAAVAAQITEAIVQERAAALHFVEESTSTEAYIVQGVGGTTDARSTLYVASEIDCGTASPINGHGDDDAALMVDRGRVKDEGGAVAGRSKPLSPVLLEEAVVDVSTAGLRSRRAPGGTSGADVVAVRSPRGCIAGATN